jgi:hypothetical protein
LQQQQKMQQQGQRQQQQRVQAQVLKALLMLQAGSAPRCRNWQQLL